MGIELKKTKLVKQIEHLAAEQTQSVETVLEAAVQTYLDDWERKVIHAETKAFWAMYDQLVEKYRGEHIALHQGQVVDHDKDASRLEKRVREQFGWSPVLIAPVKSGHHKDLRWIGGRIESK